MGYGIQYKGFYQSFYDIIVFVFSDDVIKLARSRLLLHSDVQRTSHELCTRAVDCGSNDDISVIVIAVNQ